MKHEEKEEETSLMFHGTALCEVDQEGNVTIPAFLAEALEGRAAELLVSLHAADNCLVGYAREHLDRLPGATIRIPAAMRHLGRIGTLALFVGTGDSFEIWNPDLAIENEDEQFRGLAAYQLNARGGSTNGLGVH